MVGREALKQTAPWREIATWASVTGKAPQSWRCCERFRDSTKKKHISLGRQGPEGAGRDNEFKYTGTCASNAHFMGV